MNRQAAIIQRLKRRFIALATTSLFVLLSLIVAGMNIINYNKVVSDADARVEVIEQNSERFQNRSDGDFPFDKASGDFRDEFLFGRGGPGGPKMSMDEAEESRFFSVMTDQSGTVVKVNTDRISAVDDGEAAEYAERAVESGKEKGFTDDFRYSISRDAGGQRITFLDCGRMMDSFRSFLRASIIMSLAGLAFVFAFIVFMAGRIVRPVAESYDKQKRFITDAGHEIKTPLAIIKANLDLIRMDPGSTDEGIDEINEQVDRLTGLTNDLVYLSRMEEGEGSLVMSDVPLSDVVSETAASFEALAKDKGKSIEADIEPMLSIRGSAKELEKLISILMENAVKYADETEPVRLSLKREAGNAVIEVSNKTKEKQDGESLAHVFDRFYRTDESRNSSSGGHGIGLSMASAIVAAHRGRISANTTDGYDFTVRASLPM